MLSVQEAFLVALAYCEVIRRQNRTDFIVKLCSPCRVIWNTVLFTQVYVQLCSSKANIIRFYAFLTAYVCIMFVSAADGVRLGLRCESLGHGQGSDRELLGRSSQVGSCGG